MPLKNTSNKYALWWANHYEKYGAGGQESSILSYECSRIWNHWLGFQRLQRARKWQPASTQMKSLDFICSLGVIPNVCVCFFSEANNEGLYITIKRTILFSRFWWPQKIIQNYSSKISLEWLSEINGRRN